VAPPGGPGPYRVTHLAALGGTASSGNSIDDRGWVAGSSSLPGDAAVHATLWRDGEILDLGTLGGPNSSVAWPVKNVRGMVVGIAETDTPDPLGERWSCSAFFPALTGKTCLGFVWRDGLMRPLPTLGGNNGYAAAANDRGEVAGWAETADRDPSCVPPQVLGFQAVVWGPGEGELRSLPPFPGDSAGAATAINDRGQVVGISGACGSAVGRFSAAHALLWDRGAVKDLGDLGGVAWNTPTAINRHGVVVGFANTAGGTPGGFHPHAFLWTEKDGMRDLGMLHADDRFSEALGINDAGQVVGMSCGTTCNAFIWQDGVMTDLNALAPGYAGHLVFAGDIDELGEITGGAFDPATGDSPAFVAVPLAGR
jgi:probable HAF family extracellular repeat protein